jgi:hypothetical protein
MASWIFFWLNFRAYQHPGICVFSLIQTTHNFQLKYIWPLKFWWDSKLPTTIEPIKPPVPGINL